MLRIFKHYYPIRNLFFFLGEGLFIIIACYLGAYLLPTKETAPHEFSLFNKSLLLTFVIQICLYYSNLYEFGSNENLKKLLARLLNSLGIAVIILAFIILFLPQFTIRFDIFFLSVFILFVLILSWRLAYNQILKRGLFDKKIIIIGSEGLAQHIINEVNTKKDCGYTIASIVLDKYHKGTISDARAPIIRKIEYKGLCELVKKLKIDTIVVAIKEKRNRLPIDELLKCRVDGVEIIDGNSFYEMLKGKFDVTNINPSWLIFSDGFKKSRLISISKRITDVLLSSIVLILLFPLLLIVALLIKVDTKGPVFYSQERVGKDKNLYFLLKFRSMCVNAEKECGPVWAANNDNRVTSIGRIIRALRIDEIPQVWNVLKGEMSFVGPRPEREFFVRELEKKIPYYQERFSVKPGITGWAQVNYNYGASIEDAVEKLNYDLFYIKNMSLFMDIVIVFRTIKTVIFRSGAR